MLKANGLWPQTSGVEERGQTSAWQVARALELLDDCGQRKPNLSALALLLCVRPAQHPYLHSTSGQPPTTPLYIFSAQRLPIYLRAEYCILKCYQSKVWWCPACSEVAPSTSSSRHPGLRVLLPPRAQVAASQLLHTAASSNTPYLLDPFGLSGRPPLI